MFNRSLTPHLSLYRSHITSIMSIFHRLTGLFLCCLILCFCILSNLFFFFSFYDLPCLIFCFFLVKNVSFLLLFLILYHLFNGLRHIFWDFCMGLNIDNIHITGYLTFTVSLLFISCLILF